MNVWCTCKTADKSNNKNLPKINKFQNWKPISPEQGFPHCCLFLFVQWLASSLVPIDELLIDTNDIKQKKAEKPPQCASECQEKLLWWCTIVILHIIAPLNTITVLLQHSHSA